MGLHGAIANNMEQQSHTTPRESVSTDCVFTQKWNVRRVANASRIPRVDARLLVTQCLDGSGARDCERVKRHG